MSINVLYTKTICSFLFANNQNEQCSNNDYSFYSLVGEDHVEENGGGELGIVSRGKGRQGRTFEVDRWERQDDEDYEEEKNNKWDVRFGVRKRETFQFIDAIRFFLLAQVPHVLLQVVRLP